MSYSDLEGMLLSANEVSEREMTSLCQKVMQRILVTCGGLLEVHQPLSPDFESEETNERSSEADSEQLNSSPDDDTLASDFDRENVHNSSLSQEVESPYSNSTQRDSASTSESETRDAESLFNSSVNFAHRTAVEFLENAVSGKEFLERNSSRTFNPQVSYVKALLGELKTKGFRDDVDYIMSVAADVEDSSGIAQTSLCELIDHTMSTIDLKHPDFDPNSHWCTRWGEFARFCKQGKETSWTTSSSRSISPDSFYSAASEFTAIPIGSPYFLGFAAWHGLSGYVLQLLDREEKSVGPEVLDYVLFCSVTVDAAAELQRHVTYEEKLITQLLNRGADPNVKFLGKTIWIHFLEHLFLVWKSNIIYQGSSPPDSQALTRCAIAFIEHSADVSSSWAFHFRRSLLYSPIVQLSALSLIEAVMQHKPGFAQIRETAINRGAVYYSRWTLPDFENEGEHESYIELLEQHFVPSSESRVRSARQNLYDQPESDDSDSSSEKST